MAHWTPSNCWQGQTAYIIGGGRSLEAFPFGLLAGKNTIGCNSAFTLGPEVCRICLFSDFKFFETYHDQLKEFEGLVVTTHAKIVNAKYNWVRTMQRRQVGLYHDAIGFNGNTGAGALNLALILGATTVYMLGFDMKLTNGQSNWHALGLDKPNSAVYDRMMKNFVIVKKDLDNKFPGHRVINVNDDSDLKCFETMSRSEFERGLL